MRTHWLDEVSLRITSDGWQPYRWEEPCEECATKQSSGLCFVCGIQNDNLAALYEEN